LEFGMGTVAMAIQLSSQEEACHVQADNEFSPFGA
jgi:hypothetical protein